MNRRFDSYIKKLEPKDSFTKYLLLTVHPIYIDNNQNKLKYFDPITDPGSVMQAHNITMTHKSIDLDISKNITTVLLEAARNPSAKEKLCG